eukprot:685011-Prorocentrum_minimum.AAC.3
MQLDGGAKSSGGTTVAAAIIVTHHCASLVHCAFAVVVRACGAIIAQKNTTLDILLSQLGFDASLLASLTLRHTPASGATRSPSGRASYSFMCECGLGHSAFFKSFS